jgi:hypothetical protein
MSDEAIKPSGFDRDAYRSVRARTEEMKAAGARMITIVAKENDEGAIDLIYLFDLGGRFADFHFTILPEWEVDSVVDILPAARNMEREVVDLFGLHFKGVSPGLLLEPGKGVVAPLRRKKEEKGKEEVGTDG